MALFFHFLLATETTEATEILSNISQDINNDFGILSVSSVLSVAKELALIGFVFRSANSEFIHVILSHK